MLGRSPGRTPGVLSNRTAVPVRLLSRASPPPRPSPSGGEGAKGRELMAARSALRSQGPGPDALLARGEDAVRVEGVLQGLVEAALRVVVEVVLLGHQVHVRQVGAVEAVPVTRQLADQVAVRRVDP